jgi:carbon monoxide dehydrogenase subunit G
VDIEKVMNVAAPVATVWRMLLDPKVMGGCVPGMKSIEVISDTEYVAVIHVKISFISAKFKLRTTIVEQRAPHYLRCEGTGEDASVASSLKQQSEIFLAELPDGGTELRMKVKVDVLGRLGTFGLSVMKTKADRMWDEFGQNLLARLTTGETAPVEPAQTTPAPAPAVHSDVSAPQTRQARGGWWHRLLGLQAPSPADEITVEIRRTGETITVRWPVTSAAECAHWLQDYLKRP